MMARFGPGVKYFSFFGAVEAPEEEYDEGVLRRFLRRRKTLWKDRADGIYARAVRGPYPRTAVLEVCCPEGGWEEVGVVSWPMKFVAPGGHAGGLRYGVRRGNLPPGATVSTSP
jgi:hypothetical protein